MPRRRFHATLPPSSSASLVTTLTCGFPYHSHNASWPRGGPRTPLCAPVSQAAQQLKNPPSMIWRQRALTCRAALPTYSIGMRLLHRHKNAHTLTHTHTLMGDMRPADAATVSGDTFLTALNLSGRVSQLSPASACRRDCCCCCCWRSLTHFFFLSSVGTAPQTVFADCATRHAIGPTKRENTTLSLLFLSFFAQHEYRDRTHTLAEVHLIVSVVLHFGHAGVSLLEHISASPLGVFTHQNCRYSLTRLNVYVVFPHSRSPFLLLSPLNLNVCYFVRKKVVL